MHMYMHMYIEARLRGEHVVQRVVLAASDVGMRVRAAVGEAKAAEASRTP